MTIEADPAGEPAERKAMELEPYYTRFYGLRFSPFRVTPDPDHLMMTEGHKEAFAAILYGVAARKGFIVITGEVGVGKTSVLRAAVECLDVKTTRLVYIFDPNIAADELYRKILEDLDEPATAPGGGVLHRLQMALLRLYAQKINVVLAIDEAQNTPEATLESLRLLSNLETRADKLLQIVLVGQPEFDAILAKRSMRQLRQRIAVRVTIPRLSHRQSLAYVGNRLELAGRKDGDALFTGRALRYLVSKADGVPRRLNIYCDNALINGYGYEAPRIDLPIVREALRELTRSERSHGHRLRVALAAGSICVIAIAVAAGGRWRHDLVEWAGAQRTLLADFAAASTSTNQMRSIALPQPEAPSATAGAPALDSPSPPQAPAEPPRPAAAAASQPPAANPPHQSAAATAPPTPPSAAPSRAESAASASPAPSSSAAPSAPTNVAAAPQPAPAATPQPAPATASSGSGNPASGSGNTAAQSNVRVAATAPAPEPKADPPGQAPAISAAAPAPAQAQAPTQAQADSDSVMHVVKRGEHLYALCRTMYRRCDKGVLDRVLQANPQIRDSNHVEPGEKIVFPDAKAPNG